MAGSGLYWGLIEKRVPDRVGGVSLSVVCAPLIVMKAKCDDDGNLIY